MDTASFFFSFEFCLPGTALRPLSGRAPEVAPRLRKKTLAAPVLIVQNESCLLSNDSPWHHSRSGRNWPDMWGFWKLDGEVPWTAKWTRTPRLTTNEVPKVSDFPSPDRRHNPAVIWLPKEPGSQ